MSQACLFRQTREKVWKNSKSQTISIWQKKTLSDCWRCELGFTKFKGDVQLNFIHLHRRSLTHDNGVAFPIYVNLTQDILFPFFSRRFDFLLPFHVAGAYVWQNDKSPNKLLATFNFSISRNSHIISLGSVNLSIVQRQVWSPTPFIVQQRHIRS